MPASNNIGLYRMYRREPIKRGDWYHSVICHGCQLPIYFADDQSRGKSEVKFVGDAHLVMTCTRCLLDDRYKPSEVVTLESNEDLPGAQPQRIKISKASRKPLLKSHSKAWPTFGIGYIEDRPLAASIVARIITSWADIEVECANLLAEMMDTNVGPTAAVFGVLRSSRAQYDALNAVAEEVLSEEDYELFGAHMLRRGALESERNDLAHGRFGISPAIPEHVVWVAQADFIKFMASGDMEAFRGKQFVYETGTLERIAQEIEEFYEQLGFFRGYLVSRRDNSQDAKDFRAARFPQLCSQPHIDAALARVRAQKNKPQS